MNILSNWNSLIDTVVSYRKQLLDDESVTNTVESLHKCRTAIRRIQTVVWLSKKLGHEIPLIKPLKVFFSLTSDIRDLDLLINWLKGNNDSDSKILTAALLPHCALAKINAKEYLLRKIDDSYLNNLRLWATSTKEEHDINAVAKSLKIDAFLILENFKEISGEIFLSDDALLHSFRKEIKKIRYGYELLRTEGFEDLHIGFKELQDKLGAVQDAVAWKQWLKIISADESNKIKLIEEMYLKAKTELAEFLGKEFRSINKALNYDL